MYRGIIAISLEEFCKNHKPFHFEQFAIYGIVQHGWPMQQKQKLFRLHAQQNTKCSHYIIQEDLYIICITWIHRLLYYYIIHSKIEWYSYSYMDVRIVWTWLSGNHSFVCTPAVPSVQLEWMLSQWVSLPHSLHTPPAAYHYHMHIKTNTTYAIYNTN